MPKPGTERYLAVLMGRPGSGKTSALQALASHRAVRVVRASGLLRDAAGRDTAEARELRRRMEAGELVETERVARLVGDRVLTLDAALVILDGFPRRADQVQPLRAILGQSGRRLSLVLVLALARSMAEKRLTGRRVCAGCDAVYNVHHDPPPPGACRRCGGRLERREDDRPDVVRERQERFERDVKPVYRWFGTHRAGAVRCIRGDGSPEEVRRALVEAIHRRHPSIVPAGPNRTSNEGESS